MKIPCNEFESTYIYWLLYNDSLVKQSFLDNMNAPLSVNYDALRTARGVENALSNFIVKQKDPTKDPEIEHNFGFQNYPKVQSRVFNNFDTSSVQGSFWFFIPIVISFLTLLSEIVKEKETKLRQGLILFGVQNLSYWVSWVAFVLSLDLLFAALIVGTGKLSGFPIFTKSPFILMYANFFCEIFCYHSLALLMSTLISDTKSASKFGYGVMLLALLVQIFFGNSTLITFMYVKDYSWYIQILIFIVKLIPSFHFCNAFMSIVDISGTNLDRKSASFVE